MLTRMIARGGTSKASESMPLALAVTAVPVIPFKFTYSTISNLYFPNTDSLTHLPCTTGPPSFKLRTESRCSESGRRRLELEAVVPGEIGTGSSGSRRASLQHVTT